MKLRRRGFTLVELMIVLAIIAIVAAFAIPNLMKSRMSANETAAVGALRAIMSAEATYINRHGVYGDLASLASENMIDASLASGKKSGYYFGEIDTEAHYSYCFGAIPQEDGKSGEKEYVVAQQGTIYEANLASTMTTTSATTDWGEHDAINTTDGVPADFTVAPEDDSTNWTPIAE